MLRFRPRTLPAATLLAAAAMFVAASAAHADPTPGTSPALPGPPADLHVTAVTSTSVTLAWTASTPTSAGIDGYEVSYNQAFNDIVWLLPVGNVTTVTIASNIRPTGQYSFNVRAKDTLGHSSYGSNTVSVVTPASDTAADRTPPTAPTGLQVTGTSTAGAALAWSPSTDDVAVTGYHVYRFDGLFVSTLVATVTGTSYTAPIVTPRDTFYVRARDAAGNLSATSNMVSAPNTTTTPTTPPPAPTCRMTFKTSSQWAGGFVADVQITNTGTAAVTGWVLTFTFGGDQKVANSWSATFSQSGAAVTLTALSWNRNIPAGGSVWAGLIGSWTSSAAPPTAAALNGAACTLG